MRGYNTPRHSIPPYCLTSAWSHTHALCKQLVGVGGGGRKPTRLSCVRSWCWWIIYQRPLTYLSTEVRKIPMPELLLKVIMYNNFSFYKTKNKKLYFLAITHRKTIQEHLCVIEVYVVFVSWVQQPPPLNLWKNEINKYDFGNVFTTKRGDFWWIRKCCHLLEKQGLG